MRSSVITLVIHLTGIFVAFILSVWDIIPIALHISYVFSSTITFVFLQHYLLKKGIRNRVLSRYRR